MTKTPPAHFTKSWSFFPWCLFLVSLQLGTKEKVQDNSYYIKTASQCLSFLIRWWTKKGTAKEVDHVREIAFREIIAVFFVLSRPGAYLIRKIVSVALAIGQ